MSARPRTILVADDDDTARLLMEAALVKAGFEVSAAVDGEDALRRFAAAPSDMAMLDVDMPGLDGFAVCARLRAAHGDELPIVMVTAMDDLGSVQRAFDAGATDFIPKPINWNLIGHRVRYLFRSTDALAELRSANARNSALLDALPDTLLRLDADGRTLQFSSPAGKPFPHRLPCAGDALTQWLPEETARLLHDATRRARDTGGAVTLHCELADHGVTRTYEARLAAITARETLCLLRDVTERVIAESALRDSEARLRQAQSVARLGSWEIDLPSGRLTWSDETYRIFGIERGTPMTLDGFRDCIHPDDADAVEAAWQGALDGAPYRIEHRILSGDRTRWVLEQAEVARDADGRPTVGVGTVQDVTERKQAELNVHRLAYFDTLTGLPNRLSFFERLEREIARAQRSRERMAVLFLDLDGFKDVNDTRGHGAGDLLLQWVADRLRQGVRPSDAVARPGASMEIARLGGDEFTVLLTNLHHPNDALRVAHRIHDLIRRPFRLGDREVVLTTSIGIALHPDDGEDASTLLKHADTAMYHAKDQGRNNCQFYSASLTEEALRRLDLESNLRVALERGEFFLEYQPQLDVASGRVKSVEALMRWRHPTHGLIPPMQFVPAAEENGLIVPIGDWVLRESCAQAARWQADGIAIGVAVNLSAVQFARTQVAARVRTALAEAGLDPRWLELEVTEGALMDDNDITLSTLKALREAGIRLALDDFGTGYSSLSYLHRLPLNILKIDKSFVRGLPSDRDSLTIVRTIVSLAKNLGFELTAEGVETAEQARVLRELGCETLQGYHVGRPMSADAVTALLRGQRHLESTS